ncbi:hypothetical protein pb186bvf_011059 [Paramecium bursaria]
MEQLKTIGLKVYYIVLKQHRVKLPKDLRDFGDQYVKEEFRQAHQKANKEQYIEFLERWQSQFQMKGLSIQKNWRIRKKLEEILM